MKLADMRRTKAEKSAREKRWTGPMDTEGDYHHGLRVSLDHDSMNKVGMKETPAPGDEYRIEAHGRVVSSSDSAREGQSPDRRVEILIHRMGAEPKAKSDDGKSVKDDVRAAADKWEGSAADNRIDKREAAKRGIPRAEFEGSAADNRIDAKAKAGMKR